MNKSRTKGLETGLMKEGFTLTKISNFIGVGTCFGRDRKEVFEMVL